MASQVAAEEAGGASLELGGRQGARSLGAAGRGAARRLRGRCPRGPRRAGRQAPSHSALPSARALITLLPRGGHWREARALGCWLGASPRSALERLRGAQSWRAGWRPPPARALAGQALELPMGGRAPAGRGSAHKAPRCSPGCSASALSAPLALGLPLALALKRLPPGGRSA